MVNNSEWTKHPLKFVGRNGLGEFWVRGTTMFSVVPLLDDFSPELKKATVRRRNAMFNGMCLCGAVLDLRTHSMEHENDCPAADDNYMRLLREWQT